MEETSARRSLMTSLQREQVERLLADDDEVNVVKEEEVKVEMKEEVKVEGRRRSARHSTTTRYKQESESESAESDLEEIMVKRGTKPEDKQEQGLEALKELEAFEFAVKPKTETKKAVKGGLSISIARQKPAMKRKMKEEILEIIDSSEEEDDDDEVEEVEFEEKKTRSGRVSRKPREVSIPSKKKMAPASKRGQFGISAPRRKKQKAESDSDGDVADDDEDDDVMEEKEVVVRRGLRRKMQKVESDSDEDDDVMVEKEKVGRRGLRRGLRTSARRVQTVDLD